MTWKRGIGHATWREAAAARLGKAAVRRAWQGRQPSIMIRRRPRVAPGWASDRALEAADERIGTTERVHG
jgi:hypothetical protein